MWDVPFSPPYEQRAYPPDVETAGDKARRSCSIIRTKSEVPARHSGKSAWINGPRYFAP